MQVQDLLQAGNLTEALVAQIEQVKRSPTDVDGRFILFSLLCFVGDLERAGRHLETLVHQDPGLAMGNAVYAGLLASEASRRAVYAGAEAPLLPDAVPPDVRHRIDALAHAAAGEAQKVEAAVGLASGLAAAPSGKLDGRAFDEIRDYDSILGSVLEIFAGGRYLWMPFDRIRALTIQPPKSVLDLLWIPAQLMDASGANADIHLPVLYANSHVHADDRVKLGQMTEWEALGNAGFMGSGQRTFVTASGDECAEDPLFTIRRLDVDSLETHDQEEAPGIR